MTNYKDAHNLSGSYALKREIEKEIKKTEADTTGEKTFIPAIGNAVLLELSGQLERVETQIEEAWKRIEKDNGQRVAQVAFKFYWDCSITEDEIPF